MRDKIYVIHSFQNIDGYIPYPPESMALLTSMTKKNLDSIPC